MKVDFQKNGKKAAIGVGLGIAGAMLSNLIANNAPDNVKKFADVGTLAIGVVGLASDNEYAQAIGTGACAMAGINLVQKHLVQKAPAIKSALPPLAEPTTDTTVSGLGELEELEEIQMLGFDEDTDDLEGFEDYEVVNEPSINLSGFDKL